VSVAAVTASGLTAVALTPSATAAPIHPATTRVARASTQTAQAVSTRSTASEVWAAKLPKPKPIHWVTCKNADLAAAHAQCGNLIVPLNWNRPRGAKISIRVSKVAATAKKSLGVILVNPGGPGGSGLSLSTLGSDVPNGVGGDYTWVGFDPRGVGASSPHLSCIKNYAAGPRPPYRPTTKKILHEWLNRTRKYDAACAKSSARRILNHITTRDVAKDMDYLRAAMHQKKISYYGFSYGTYLGQVYSTLFPHHVKRMVLDSTVDPRGVWYKANLAQDVAFQKTETIWFQWLAKYHAVYHLGATTKAVQQTFNRAKNRLQAHPAGGVVGPDEWTDIFLNAGYYEETWLQLAGVFAGWVHGRDLKTLKAAYRAYVGPTDDNEFAVYNAVQCTDTQWPTSWAKWQRDNDRVYKKAPFETWDNAWFNAPCLFWPGKASTPVKINGKAVSSVLMIDEKLDAATPYEGSLYVRSLYPHASLIAEPGGTSHADSLFGDKCVDDQIATYLATGKKPARKHGYRADAFCKPLPKPVPTSSSSSARVNAAAAAVVSRGGATVG
jgi:pimeloyl-ACP methyl ester carboxylesterase